MLWEQLSLETALVRLKEAFELDRDCGELAIVWREGGEYNILPAWIIRYFRDHLDWRQLKVVMFLTREETTWLMGLIKKGIEG